MPVLHYPPAPREWQWNGSSSGTSASNNRLALTPDQKVVVIVACCYVAGIALLSWLPVVNWIFYPFRLLAVGFHEFSHAAVGLLTCAKIESIELDPYEGGVTRMRGGIPALTLPAGYTGSAFIGAALIACGFDEKASKIASIVVGVFFLITLWWARRDWFTWLLVIVRTCYSPRSRTYTLLTDRTDLGGHVPRLLVHQGLCGAPLLCVVHCTSPPPPHRTWLRLSADLLSRVSTTVSTASGTSATI